MPKLHNNIVTHFSKQMLYSWPIHALFMILTLPLCCQVVKQVMRQEMWKADPDRTRGEESIEGEDSLNLSIQSEFKLFLSTILSLSK